LGVFDTLAFDLVPQLSVDRKKKISFVCTASTFVNTIQSLKFEILKMSDDRGTTSFKVIPFSRKAVDWPVWSEKFLARARRKGYKKILLGKEVILEDATDLNTIIDADDKKKKEKLRELNEDAYEDFILSINRETEVG